MYTLESSNTELSEPYLISILAIEAFPYLTCAVRSTVLVFSILPSLRIIGIELGTPPVSSTVKILFPCPSTPRVCLIPNSLISLFVY
jgi:hypothetical protein